ncbi:DUF3043 domain-containing protein [Stackebrandtia nassauensis]|uniref:DUF3043 domain-containing protein n=1 Tax=Stackebrandtia nassauensis TaxID=283811 RepID=UPI00145DDA5A|nr:DUF3043 domain-containing protein [Stackebrandtia nassauensis]
MPALFKRKSRDESTEDVEQPESAVEDLRETKKVRDKSDPTPKRKQPSKKRPPKNPPKTYKEAREQAKAGKPTTKEAKRELAAERRAERLRVADGQDKGDPLFDQYHMPRDKGPERLLVRDVVDARFSIGQYFFIIAIVIMLFSNPAYGMIYDFVVFAWIAVLLLFVIDSVLLCRKVKRLVKKRFPKTTQRMGGLYWYAVSRSIMFKRMRMPKPRTRVNSKTPEEQLGKQFK